MKLCRSILFGMKSGLIPTLRNLHAFPNPFLRRECLLGLLLPLFLICSPGCVRSGSYGKKPVVVVNDKTLVAEDFAERLAHRLKDLDALSAKDPAHIRRAKDTVINDFVIQCLVSQWAEIKNIKVSADEVDAAINKVRAGYPEDSAFRQALADQGLSLSDWREKMRYSVLERAVFKSLQVAKTPSEIEISTFYQNNKDNFKRKERIYLRQVLVDDEGKANLIRQEAKTRDLAVLAPKYSMAPDAREGGVIGWIEKGSVDYFDPLFSQPVGHLSQPISSPFGFHIVKVEKKQPAQVLSLEAVKDLIIRDLQAKNEQAVYLKWLDGQIRSSKIQKDLELIEAMQISTRGENE